MGSLFPAKHYKELTACVLLVCPVLAVLLSVAELVLVNTLRSPVRPALEQTSDGTKDGRW